MNEEELRRYETHMQSLLCNEGGKLDRKLKLAAFYILCAEELRAAILEKARSFFNLDGQLARKPDLPENLRDLASPKSDKRLKAAVQWFVDLAAFNDDDKDLVSLAIGLRNDAAHRLHMMLLDHTEDRFSEWVPFSMIVLTNKINRWWIKNFEAEIDPQGFENFSEDDLNNSETIAASLTRHLFLAAFPGFAAKVGTTAR
ncbi:MAG: hypothetical protein U1E48_00130 [Paracoccaceae bacterium]